MNRRLEKLWDQANTRWTCDYKLSGKPREEWRSVPDLFAELIIEDACRALSPMLRDMISRGQAVELIRQHFGVED